MGTLLTSWLTAGMCIVVAFKETVNMESPPCYVQNPFSEGSGHSFRFLFRCNDAFKHQRTEVFMDMLLC